MKTHSKPISIPDDIAARCTGPDQAWRMDALFRKVIEAPRSTVTQDSAKRGKQNNKAQLDSSARPSAE